MKHFFMTCLFALFIFAGPLAGQGIRRAVWAGQFYEASADRLSRQVEELLSGIEPAHAPPAGLAALIVPHAGYVYSGAVAAHAYRLVQGLDIDTVVVIGVAHRVGFKGASIYLKGGYATPLGVVKVDEDKTAALAQATGFGFVPEAHREEHSIEVQVPFIQKALPQSKIVPVLMGLPTKESMQVLAQALSGILAKTKSLVIVSTDMSHFLSKKQANALDAETITLLKTQNLDSLIEHILDHDNRMCGGGGVVTALLLARQLGQSRVEILKYADSSDSGGDARQVVGYLSAAVFVDKDKPAGAGALARAEQKELLNMARTAVAHMVRDSRIWEAAPQHPDLQIPAGAFVTLKKAGRLRGCIGFTEPVGPLYKTVILAAIYAATRDNRFPPVAESELDALDIEISVLSPAHTISDPGRIEVGVHGLIISQGERRGLLLPQVPVENNWDRQTFLQQACLKAGLPRDAWKTGAEIRVFTAQVFH